MSAALPLPLWRVTLRAEPLRSVDARARNAWAAWAAVAPRLGNPPFGDVDVVELADESTARAPARPQAPAVAIGEVGDLNGALEKGIITPMEAAAAALGAAIRAAGAGDCAAAEVAQDNALAALEASCAASAQVVVQSPGSPEAREAKAETSRVGDLFAQVCLEHSRARVAARRRASR